MTFSVALVLACMWLGQQDCNALMAAQPSVARNGPYAAWTDTVTHHVFVRVDQQGYWAQLLVHEAQHVKNLNAGTFTCLKSETQGYQAESDFHLWLYGMRPWWQPYIAGLPAETCASTGVP